jgi:KDO2-lipid IV(A) lauroyltransferase
LDEHLLESRAVLKCELIPRDNCARALVERLTAGQTVGMLVDRPVSNGGRPIPFFGREKSTTLLPAKLALKFDCDLVPARVERIKDARFKVTFYPPVRAGSDGGSKTDQALDMLRQVNGIFEDWIRQQPGDWFCSKRIWPKSRSNDLDRAPGGAE